MKGYSSGHCEEYNNLPGAGTKGQAYEPDKKNSQGTASMIVNYSTKKHTEDQRNLQ